MENNSNTAIDQSPRVEMRLDLPIPKPIPKSETTREKLIFMPNSKPSLNSYSKTKGLPASDGWIATKDNVGSNDSLAETLLPTKSIDKIPCDPFNTNKDCASGITYQYWRHDYSGIGGTNKEYSLYAQLESPTDADRATMNTGNAKMNYKAKKYGMNYRIGN